MRVGREEQASPHDILLGTTRDYWRLGDIAGAVTLAKAAAPYVHARPVAVRSCGGLETIFYEQLEQLYEAGSSGVETQEGD